MKKKIEIFIAVSVSLIVVILLIVGLKRVDRFSYQKSQTVWQDLLSRAGVDKPAADAKSQIVFLGDSITFQEDWGVLFGTHEIYNAGISGNTTDDILGRLDAAVSGHPQKLFLMIGINDLLRGKDVPYVFSNYEKIVSGIRTQSPDTTVYLESVLPMDNAMSGSWFGSVDKQKIIKLNSKIKSLADGNKIIFIDLYPHFCGANDVIYTKYTKDGLHLNSHGYAQWKEVLEKYVK